ncbi:DeoR family transcriptional regulator [Kineococcus sp. T13]|uniref:DeoR family transcriptional regulator n=1 Tax=Kineococcus vitellinus TaxID=2696565 RepID=UPI00141212A7|nr:DeoR family transcriptional regulator [Kineococcus vitellinus]
MISSERRRRIVAAVHADGAASVRRLAEQLQVSESTIRRDLEHLDRDGELLRTYGGALAPGGGQRPRAADAGESPFAVEREQHVELKERVAARAAGLVRDGDVVVLDIGTTTPLVARHLRGRDVTVITSNLGVLDELRGDGAVRLVVLGGVLRRNYQTLVGSLAEAALRQVNADLVLLSCTGVKPNGRVVDNMAVETPVKQAMIEAAERRVLLATEVKFPGQGSYRLCSLADVDVLVTTDGAPETTTNLCREAGGKVIRA